MIIKKIIFNDTMHIHIYLKSIYTIHIYIYKYLLNTFVFLNPRQKTKLKKNFEIKVGFHTINDCTHCTIRYFKHLILVLIFYHLVHQCKIAVF